MNRRRNNGKTNYLRVHKSYLGTDQGFSRLGEVVSSSLRKRKTYGFAKFPKSALN